MAEHEDIAVAARLLKFGRIDEAAALCESILASESGSIEALLLLARVRQQQRRFEDMLALVQRAADADPSRLGAQLQLIESLIYCGRTSDAIAQLAALDQRPGLNREQLARAAELYTNLARHEDAAARLRLAASMGPEDPRILYNLAASLIALGELREAETLLDRVIELDPEDYDAWQNRSTLRTQTEQANHVAALKERLATLREPVGEIALGYALAKELEDLGRYEESFQHLTLGARRRRSMLSYRVETDVAAIDSIIEVFDGDYFRRAPAGWEDARPIFVLGLPRSGTTLIDRILSSHDAVASLGEIRDLPFALMRLAGATQRRMELIERTAQIEPAALGRAYAESIRGYGAARSRLIDKTPLNFLYIGLIHAALPHARIVHLRRNPMDSCFAMYKTLFRAAYPFSYDLDDIAAYYVAYHRLMAHWRTVIPHAFLDVDYEGLVADQEPQTRRLLEFCGLDWQSACLEFHRNRTPAATASAAQVRQPLYTTAIHRWRRYESQLEPLRRRLRDAGIPIED